MIGDMKGRKNFEREILQNEEDFSWLLNVSRNSWDVFYYLG